jgi:hypothetical protein
MMIGLKCYECVAVSSGEDCSGTEEYGNEKECGTGEQHRCHIAMGEGEQR